MMSKVRRFISFTLVLVSSACTSVGQLPANDPKVIVSELAPGDHIIAVTRDGVHHEMVIDHVDHNKITGNDQTVQIDQIMKLERQHISWIKSYMAYNAVIGVIVLIALAPLL